MTAIDEKLIDRAHASAQAGRWRVSRARFADALEASVEKAFSGQAATSRELDRFVSGLHLEDLALACGCAMGDDGAWEHFILEHRPLLYRAADALDPSGNARELADSLYADLYGLRESQGERRSLFRYFHGRSSLATWLRAVLAQRHVDRLRTSRRDEPLPEEESPRALAAPPVTIDPDRHRYLGLMRRALERAVRSLDARDRLRLACYYAQDLTLAQTGRIVGEHEATASRQLARTRKTIRQDVEQQLRSEHRMSDSEIARCFECVTEDAGPLDLQKIVDVTSGRKESALDRSKSEEQP